MSTSPGTSVAPLPGNTCAPAGGAIAPAGAIAAIRPSATSTSRALARSPVITSSTATSEIQTALGRGDGGATRGDGAGPAQAASTNPVTAAQTDDLRRFTETPRRRGRSVGAFARIVKRGE
jgi:hypothetical protein